MHRGHHVSCVNSLPHRLQIRSLPEIHHFICFWNRLWSEPPLFEQLILPATEYEVSVDWGFGPISVFCLNKLRNLRAPIANNIGGTHLRYSYDLSGYYYKAIFLTCSPPLNKNRLIAGRNFVESLVELAPGSNTYMYTGAPRSVRWLNYQLPQTSRPGPGLISFALLESRVFNGWVSLGAKQFAGDVLVLGYPHEQRRIERRQSALPPMPLPINHDDDPRPLRINAQVEPTRKRFGDDREVRPLPRVESAFVKKARRSQVGTGIQFRLTHRGFGVLFRYPCLA